MAYPNWNNWNNWNWNAGRMVHQKIPQGKYFKWIGAYRIQLKKDGMEKAVPAIDVYGKWKNKITKSSRRNSKCASLLLDFLFFAIA